VQEALSPRLGCVQYLNARPLARGWPGEIQFDHPSLLCERLAAGELDAALVSSFEFLRNPIYSVVDDVAIASHGPVYSVFVAHDPRHDFGEIEIDPVSRTGVALMRCLLRERGQAVRECPLPEDNLSSLDQEHARLLIGDQAIRFRQKHGECYSYWDLGEAWHNLTGLPFVYALWLIRPEVLQARMIADSLRAVRDRNLANLDEIIKAENKFPAGFCAYYYQDCLRFGFGEKEKEGLRSFGNLCVKHGLLEKEMAPLRIV
jgi:predicted solute-binding protein